MSNDRQENPEFMRESLMHKDVAFAFIKPDYINDLPEIEEVLHEHGLNIVFAEKMRLSEQAIDYIYRGSQQTHFYEAMKKYLSNNDVLVLLIDGLAEETQKVLSSLKKENGADGVIRAKFQKDAPVHQDDVALWEQGKHPQQDELSVVLTQRNVLHTADDVEEAKESLQMILGKKFDSLKKRGNLPAELWDLLE